MSTADDLEEALALMREARQHLNTYSYGTESCDDCGQYPWDITMHTGACIVTRYDAFLEKHA